jgi:uncharacterized protein YbjT (DUF2867 family)
MRVVVTGASGDVGTSVLGALPAIRLAGLRTGVGGSGGT